MYFTIVSRIKSLLIATLGLFFSFAVLADQFAPELDTLFLKLEQTTDSTEIAILQTDIWFHWYQISEGNEVAQQKFDNGIYALQVANLGLAIKYFSDVVKQVPDFAEGWNRRATAHFLAGDLEASLSDIQKTLALEPRHFGALSGLSMIFEIRGDFSRAMKAERALYDLMPNNPAVIKRMQFLTKKLSGI